MSKTRDTLDAPAYRPPAQIFSHVPKILPSPANGLLSARLFGRGRGFRLGSFGWVSLLWPSTAARRAFARLPA